MAKHKIVFNTWKQEYGTSDKAVRKYIKKYLKYFNEYEKDYITKFATFADDNIKTKIMHHSYLNKSDKIVLFESLSVNGKNEVLMELGFTGDYGINKFFEDAVNYDEEFVPSNEVITMYMQTLNLPALLKYFDVDNRAIEHIFNELKNYSYGVVIDVLNALIIRNEKFDLKYIEILIKSIVKDESELDKEDKKLIPEIFKQIGKLSHHYGNKSDIREFLSDKPDIYKLCYVAYIPDYSAYPASDIAKATWECSSKVFSDFLNYELSNSYYEYLLKNARWGNGGSDDHTKDNCCEQITGEPLIAQNMIPSEVVLKVLYEEVNDLTNYFNEISKASEVIIKDYNGKDIKKMPSRLDFYLNIILNRELELDDDTKEKITDITINFYKYGIDTEFNLNPIEFSLWFKYCNDKLVDFISKISKKEKIDVLSFVYDHFKINKIKLSDENIFKLLIDGYFDKDKKYADLEELLSSKLLNKLFDAELNTLLNEVTNEVTNIESINTQKAAQKLDFYANILEKNGAMDDEVIHKFVKTFKILYDYANSSKLYKPDILIPIDLFSSLNARDKKTLDLLTEWLINSKDNSYMFKLVDSDIEYIDDENIIRITKDIVNNIYNHRKLHVGLISYFEFIDKISDIKVIKDFILKTDDKYVIACYIYVSHDDELLYKYFDKFLSFKWYIMNNNPELKEFNYNNKYVDDQIEELLENNKSGAINVLV